eukprot:s2538_g31.t1
MAIHKGGAAAKARLAHKIRESNRMFLRFRRCAEIVLQKGGAVTFEWPRDNAGWQRRQIKAFFRGHPEIVPVDIDGCMVGVKSHKGNPIKKPWRLMTSSPRIVEAFPNLRCIHAPYEHDPCEGADTARSAFYPPQMTELIVRALFLAVANNPVPAMPCVPPSDDPPCHREKEQDTKHSPLAGVPEDQAFGIALESDEQAANYLTELLDLEALMAEALDLPKREGSDPEVQAMVTKLLSRSEMLSDPEAMKAVKAEADAKCWDEASVREKDEVRDEAKKSGVSVHFGQLMTIASIKFYELAKHLQKTKGRIVYHHDCAKDEHGAAAVYQELGANPTSVQGLNACLAYGCIPGNSTTAADAIKAYIQARLSSSYKTWMELPPELRPSWWKHKFVKPVVLLVKALYGHPEAGGLWEKHLKSIIHKLGGVETPEYPGDFYFADSRLLLSTYVDDPTLSGPTEEHEAFWKKLTAQVDVEPPEPVYRILGRNHVAMKLPAVADQFQCAAFRAQNALVLDMADYAVQTVDLYKQITGATKLKKSATSFVPEGSILPADESVKGGLAPNACKILMKALWLGRLARPDIVKPINDLATKVQAWTPAEDKKLLRLISYIDSTPHYRLVGTVNDKPEDLHLELFVDADFSGDKESSTTESEVKSLAHALFAEGLPALTLWEQLLQRSVRLIVHEDNQATILVVKKGYSPKLRRIQRTHKVNLGSLSEVFVEDTASLEYCRTEDRAADIFTKALPPQKWGAALTLLGLKNLQRLLEIFEFYAKLTADCREGKIMLTYMRLGPDANTGETNFIPSLELAIEAAFASADSKSLDRFGALPDESLSSDDERPSIDELLMAPPTRRQAKSPGYRWKCLDVQRRGNPADEDACVRVLPQVKQQYLASLSGGTQPQPQNPGSCEAQSSGSMQKVDQEAYEERITSTFRSIPFVKDSGTGCQLQVAGTAEVKSEAEGGELGMSAGSSFSCKQRRANTETHLFQSQFSRFSFSGEDEVQSQSAQLGRGNKRPLSGVENGSDGTSVGRFLS